ncbi:MAG: WG repeat-containing protein [Bacteroidota bacterium]
MDGIFIDFKEFNVRIKQVSRNFYVKDSLNFGNDHYYYDYDGNLIFIEEKVLEYPNYPKIAILDNEIIRIPHERENVRRLLAWNFFETKQGDKYGLADHLGNVYLEPEFEYVNLFKSHQTVLAQRENNLVHLDLTTGIQKELPYQGFQINKNHNVATVYIEPEPSKKFIQKAGLINEQGEEIIPPIYAKIECISLGNELLVETLLDEPDTPFEFMDDAQYKRFYEEEYDPWDDFANEPEVFKDSTWGLRNTKNEEILPNKYGYIGCINSTTFIVGVNCTVVSFQYKSDRESGLKDLSVYDGNWGVVGLQGKTIVPLFYDRIEVEKRSPVNKTRIYALAIPATKKNGAISYYHGYISDTEVVDVYDLQGNPLGTEQMGLMTEYLD